MSTFQVTVQFTSVWPLCVRQVSHGQLEEQGMAVWVSLLVQSSDSPHWVLYVSPISHSCSHPGPIYEMIYLP